MCVYVLSHRQPVFQGVWVETSSIIFHLCLSQNPVQEWGEEFEDGALYGVTLRREPVTSASNSSSTDPCCAFVQYRTCKVRRLKAASLELLANHLLDPCCQDQDYSRIFLSTYRTFSSASELIELLFQRYRHILVHALICHRLFSQQLQPLVHEQSRRVTSGSLCPLFP